MGLSLKNWVNVMFPNLRPHASYYLTLRVVTIVGKCHHPGPLLLSGVPDYFYRNKISSGGDLSHYSSASLY